MEVELEDRFLSTLGSGYAGLGKRKCLTIATYRNHIYGF